MSNVLEKNIDGELFEKLIVSGANNLKAHLQTVNDLNVFPVPDGDTGDNMYKTLSGGVANLQGVQENSLSQKAKALAKGMLLNARGNSGVILSQLFSGMASGLSALETASVDTFAKAFLDGVEQAYKAVAKPVEGTILTVAREAAEYAAEHSNEESTLGTFFNDYITEMKKSLDRTPELLQVLQEAGVIDSGGAGLLYIAQGMKDAVEGKQTEELAVSSVAQEKQTEIDYSAFNENSEMSYGYCTEILLQLLSKKGDPDAFSLENLIAFLESIGDSVVAFRTGTVIKLHVHTLTPYKVLEYCQVYGEFLNVKIENMTLQHNETITAEKKEEKPIVSKQKHKKFALVTVASGQGLIQTFQELGADVVIDGGQGDNPSIERFIQAFEEANGEYIFVLPNNSNIVMAAKQAAEIYKEAEIIVLETKNIGQAYSILSMLDYSADDACAIKEEMIENMQNTQTGMVTVSVRTTCVDGVAIEKDDYIAFTDKKMLASKKTKILAFESLVEKMQAEEKSYMIAVYGQDVSAEEKAQVVKFMQEKYPSLEFYELEGGQKVYEFIVIAE